MASLVVVTPPASEPLTLAQAKSHLRITSSAEDSDITGMITAARKAVERWCKRGLITQTVRLRLDAFPVVAIRLPWGRAASITSVTYVDTDGDTQTLASYHSDLDSLPARITPAYGESWPQTRDQLAAVSVTYVVGAAAADEDVVAAIKLLIGDMYANREASVIGVSVAENPAVRALLDPHCIDLLGLELDQ